MSGYFQLESYHRMVMDHHYIITGNSHFSQSKWQLQCVHDIKSTSVGPSIVGALPLAAGRNEGGPYFRYVILVVLFLPPLFKIPEGVVVGF